MEKKRFRIIANLVLLVCFMVVALGTEMFSFIGWYREGDKMSYLDKNGYKFATTWIETDGMRFYLGEDGYVVYNRAFDYNGNLYCVDSKGARVENNFVEITPDMIVDDSISPGLYYFNERGVAVRRHDSVFTHVINGKKYAFDEEGHVLQDCWLDENGEVIYDADTILDEGMYYINPDGSLKQNEWLNFFDDLGSVEDMGTSKFISTAYSDMNGLWMYFKSNGKKVKATEANNSLERMNINGKNYAFDEKGIMLLGFEKNREEVDRTQPSNPTIKNKIRVYDYVEGDLLKNKWLHEITPEDFDQDDYKDGSDYWFYVEDTGSLAKNKIEKIDKKKYIFDGFGRMRKGFILVDGTSFYVAEYKSEDLTKEDFIYSVAEGGRLYGSDLSDLHYFDESDEDTEGTMKTGEFTVDLSDGTYTFNFKASGKAYGNKNELKQYKNSYYKNGLKFMPWEETKYGIVKISDDEYKVINESGKIIEAKRKLIKDDYGNYIVILGNKLAGYIVEPRHKVQLRWKTFGGVTGYYYYDLDLEKKDYTGLAVASTATCPTADMLNNIPNEMKVNFR